jgi:competence-damaged protein
MAFSKALTDLAKQALEAAKAKNCSIVAAESCTAGKLSGLLSDAPGASALLHGGFVAYTKDNKNKRMRPCGELFNGLAASPMRGWKSVVPYRRCIVSGDACDPSCARDVHRGPIAFCPERT